VAGNSRRRGFLAGLILGGVVGSAATVWLIGRMRWWGRRRGVELGGRAGDIASIITERGSEFLSRAKEAISQAVEEGRETARKTRSDLEDRFKGESEQ